MSQAGLQSCELCMLLCENVISWVISREDTQKIKTWLQLTKSGHRRSSMKAFAFVLFAVGLLRTADASSVLKAKIEELLKQVDCPNGYIPVDAGCYKVVEDKVSWPLAMTTCLQEESWIATFETWEENEHIRRHLESLNMTEDYWIGAVETEIDEFTWMKTQEELDYHQFYPCENVNDTKNDDCIYFWTPPDQPALTNTKYWENDDCVLEKAYICEVEPSSGNGKRSSWYKLE